MAADHCAEQVPVPGTIDMPALALTWEDQAGQVWPARNNPGSRSVAGWAPPARRRCRRCAEGRRSASFAAESEAPHLGAVSPVPRCYPQTQSRALRNTNRLMVLTVARLERVR